MAPAAAGLAPDVLAEATALLTPVRRRPEDRRRRGRRRAPRQASATCRPSACRTCRPRAPMTRALALPHLLDDQAGHRRGGDDAARGGQVPARRRRCRSTCRSSPTCRSSTRPGAPPRAPARPITVEDLLLHTSGLSHRTSDLYRTLGVRSRADTLPEFIGKITRAPLMEDPHTRFRYSEATTVLGRLVEIWSGQPFDVFLRRARLHAARHDRHRVLGAARAAAIAWPPCTARRPAAASRRWRSRPCRSPSGRAARRRRRPRVDACPTTCASARCCSTRARSAARGCSRPATVARMTANGLPADVLKARGGRMGWGLGNVNVLLDAGDVRRQRRRVRLGRHRRHHLLGRSREARRSSC